MKYIAAIAFLALSLVAAQAQQASQTVPPPPTPEQDLATHWQTLSNMEAALPGVRDDFAKSAGALLTDYHRLQAQNKQLEQELAQLKKASEPAPASTNAPAAPPAAAVAPPAQAK